MMPVLVGTLIYLFVDHRYGSREAFGGNLGSIGLGRLGGHPARHLPLRHPGHRRVRRRDARCVSATRAPARGVMFGGLALIGVAALAGITQQNIQSLPWPGERLDVDDLGDKFRDLVPVRPLQRSAGARRAARVPGGARRRQARQGRQGSTVIPALAFAFFGYGMVLVGMLGNILYAADDLALQGTVFEEATLVFVVYGGVLGIFGGIAHWSPKWRGGTPSSGAVVILALARRRRHVLAAVPHYVAGFLDQPAGFAYDDSDLQIWNVLALVGHALFGLMVLGFAGLMLRVKPGDDATRPIPGAARPPSGSPPRRPPRTTSIELVLVGSAEPASTQSVRLEGSDA